MDKNIKYKISRNHFFVNPYNFVPVNLGKTERTDITQNKKELITGYIECKIKSRTHLAIPDVANKEETDVQKHYKYPFIGVKENEPRIPASSLRGVIRNVYETITDSCFGTMRENTVVTVRSKDAFRAGLLIKQDDKWILYRAKKYLLVTDEKYRKSGIQQYNLNDLNYRSGDLLHFKVAYDEEGKERGHLKSTKKGSTIFIGTYVRCICTTPDKESKTGYLCIGEKAPKRHFHGIFEKLENESQYPEFQEKDFKRLEYVLEEYRKTGNVYSSYERMKENGVIPVYYAIQAGNLYVSFAALGRKAFAKTLNEVSLEKSHQKCNGRSNLCPACALFGTVEGEGLGSRIRFTDAKCTNFDREKLLVQNVVFEELSSPRISYIPFYLKEKKNGVKYGSGYDSKDLEIRGRKFYWHHKPELRPMQKIDRNERNGTFDVLTDKAEFVFKIYFDGITETQLKLLAASVHLNDNNIDGKMCHKIGHGKPLGYGSVKMTVDSCWIRKFDLLNGWKEEKIDILCDKKYYRCDKDTYEALEKICDFDTNKQWVGVPVEYPGVVTEGVEQDKTKDNSFARYHWFMNNYGVGADEPEEKLPEIVESAMDVEKARLAKYEKISEKSDEKINEKNDKKTYIARITSSGVIARNKNYLEYNIEIQDDKYFKNKPCKMTALNKIQLETGQNVEVVLYKRTIFNFKSVK